jgi:NAD+ diphosphatase
MKSRMKAINFYAGGGLDRAGLRRKDRGWLADRLAHVTTRFVAVWRGLNLVATAPGAEPQAVFLPRRDAEAFGGDAVLLGIETEIAYFAIDLSPHETPLALLGAPAGAEFTDLRRVGPLLARSEGSLLAYARGILYWHSRHLFCGLCGAPTVSEEAGHVRRCTNPACATVHFPRTDPAVIMLIHDGERCLLGRKHEWPKGMHSTLAGFVEPGESLEEAVAREVFEETGVTIDEIAYHSSQPWPFPASLMLGFHARARTTELTIDPGELEDASWFERRWLIAHPDDENFRMPRKDSIARRLVEDWLRR